MSRSDSPTEPIDTREATPDPPRSSRHVDQAALPQFRLVRPLGEGATSRVYLANEPSGGSVVVKLVGGRFAGEGVEARRHRAALAAMAAIRHPHIMAIRAWGKALDGRVFVVMPWAEGARDLRGWMCGPMPVERVRDLGLQLLAALARIHQAGLVHRDIKPSNCLVVGGRPPQLQVFDFGSVVRVGKARLSRPCPRSIYGTRAYLAPERHDGLVGPTSDLYSTGVVLFEAFTGRRPFLAEDAQVLERQHACAPVPFVRRLVPELPESLDPFFRRALGKHPLKRFRSAASMARALQAALEGAGQAEIERFAS